MRRWLFLLIAGFALLAAPFGVAAQGSPGLANLEVDLWPEYDRPDMLVIYRVMVDQDVALPAGLTFRIPTAAGDPYNVAYLNDDGVLYSLAYTKTTAEQWTQISLTTPKRALQIEYYDPGLTKNGTNRAYTYVWPGDYAVKSLVLEIQQPSNASGLKISPSQGQASTGQNGLTDYRVDAGFLSAGQSYTVQISYQKPDNALSVEVVGTVAPSAPINSATPGRATLSSIWLWGLGVLGVVIVVVGGIWFFRSRPQPRADGRQRHAPARVSEAPASNDAVYCHQCGKRAAPGDIFCRACGTQLRRDTEAR